MQNFPETWACTSVFILACGPCAAGDGRHSSMVATGSWTASLGDCAWQSTHLLELTQSDSDTLLSEQFWDFLLLEEMIRYREAVDLP